MPIKNTPQLLEEIANRFLDNNEELITPLDARTSLGNIVESTANKITDKHLLGVKEYSSSRSYDLGDGCLYQGGLYQAIKETNGNFKPLDWVLIAENYSEALVGKENVGVAQNLVIALEESLKAGVSIDGDTLAKLRALIAALRNDITVEQGKVAAIQALLTSNDLTLDTLQEIVSFIKANKSVIDAIATNKLDKTDVVNTLTETAPGKALDARQAKVLKDLIDSLPTSAGSPNLLIFDPASPEAGNSYQTFNSLYTAFLQTTGEVTISFSTSAQAYLTIGTMYDFQNRAHFLGTQNALIVTDGGNFSTNWAVLKNILSFTRCYLQYIKYDGANYQYLMAVDSQLVQVAFQNNISLQLFNSSYNVTIMPSVAPGGLAIYVNANNGSRVRHVDYLVPAGTGDTLAVTLDATSKLESHNFSGYTNDQTLAQFVSKLADSVFLTYNAEAANIYFDNSAQSYPVGTDTVQKALMHVIANAGGASQLPTYTTTETVTITSNQAAITEDFTLVDAVVNPDYSVTFSNFNWSGFKLVHVFAFGAPQTDFTITASDGGQYTFGHPIFAYPETTITIASTNTGDSQPFQLRMHNDELVIAAGTIYYNSASVAAVQNPRTYQQSNLTIDSAGGAGLSHTFGTKNSFVAAGDYFSRLSYSDPATGFTNILAGSNAATLEYINVANGKSTILSAGNATINLTARDIVVYGDQQEVNVGGIRGSMDFRANYTPDHYVQKAYVDDAIAAAGTGGASYTGVNGIVVTGNQIELDLIEHIAIDYIYLEAPSSIDLVSSNVNLTATADGQIRLHQVDSTLTLSNDATTIQTPTFAVNAADISFSSAASYSANVGPSQPTHLVHREWVENFVNADKFTTYLAAINSGDVIAHNLGSADIIVQFRDANGASVNIPNVATTTTLTLNPASTLTNIKIIVMK